MVIIEEESLISSLCKKWVHGLTFFEVQNKSKCALFVAFVFVVIVAMVWSFLNLYGRQDSNERCLRRPETCLIIVEERLVIYEMLGRSSHIFVLKIRIINFNFDLVISTLL